MVADRWVAPVTVDPANDADAVAILTAIAAGNALPRYAVQAQLVDVAGNVLTDVTQQLVRDDQSAIRWDSTADVPGSLTVALDAAAPVTFGSSILAVSQLVRSASYNTAAGLAAGTWIRFAVAHFVLTSPGFDDLDAAQVRQITGYDKNYLLQTAPRDGFAFAYGSSYRDAVQAVFLAAGLITTHLEEVCDYPGDWSTAHTLPAPRNYSLGDWTSLLAIVNDLLSGSGCRPLYPQPSGRWRVEYTPTVAAQALRWRWYGSADPSVPDANLNARVVLAHQSAYRGDVWGQPNQWVFIQQGLTFQPGGDGHTDGTSGLYLVNNLTSGPSSQTAVGRVLRSTQALPASGPADLKTQGDAIVAAALAQAEQISLQTAPWPAARHYDVFQFTHGSLPLAPLRRVQAQQWTLPLWGQPMQWSTNVAGAL